MSAYRQPRDLRGRFGETLRPDPGSNILDGSGSGSGSGSGGGGGGGEVWALVQSPDPGDQHAAAMRLDLTAGQVEELADPSRPFTSRLAVATRADPHAVQVAAGDPDPVVRARALQSGVGLDAETRTRLEGDPGVARVQKLLGFGPGGRMLSDGEAARRARNTRGEEQG